MKKLFSILLVLTLALTAIAPALAATYTDVFTNFDQRDTWDDATTITFADDKVTIDGNGASADGTVVYITAEGSYVLSGSCANGQIIVELDKAEKAQLVLSGLTLTCLDSAPVYVASADKVSLTLVEGTIDCNRDGVLYTSIPQNGNWTAYVDGKESQIVLIGDAMCGLLLTEGSHTITFRYANAAFSLGWEISLICFLIFLIAYATTYRPNLKRKKGKYEN